MKYIKTETVDDRRHWVKIAAYEFLESAINHVDRIQAILHPSGSREQHMDIDYLSNDVIKLQLSNAPGSSSVMISPVDEASRSWLMLPTSIQTYVADLSKTVTNGEEVMKTCQKFLFEAIRIDARTGRMDLKQIAQHIQKECHRLDPYKEYAVTIFNP